MLVEKLEFIRRTFVFSLVLFVAIATTAQSPVKHVWYVAKDGSDTNPGTIAAPYQTISKGVSELAPGDTLFVRAGIYVERVAETRSGSATAPITISAYPGEAVAIDGQFKLPDAKWSPLVFIGGSYVRFNGFEVRNSGLHKNGGVVIDGEHSVASHLNVHHNNEAGVLARGNYSVVEYSTVWQNAYNNCRTKDCPTSPYPNGGWAMGVAAARNPADQGGITHHAVLRNNTIYNNWGEGLGSYEAEGTIMEDNVVYDNWSTNSYISDTSNVVFQRNLIYTTSGSLMTKRLPCITLADERKDKPHSGHNVVLNNMCLNGDVVAFAWTLVPDTGLDYALIANNTIVDGKLKTGLINQDSKILNNLILTSDLNASVPTSAGLYFANNLWSVTPPTAASGVNSIVRDPMLMRNGPTGAGQLTKDYFQLSPKSPARKAGMSLGKILTVDAMSHPRKDPPTIGAYEIP